MLTVTAVCLASLLDQGTDLDQQLAGFLALPIQISLRPLGLEFSRGKLEAFHVDRVGF